MYKLSDEIIDGMGKAIRLIKDGAWVAYQINKDTLLSILYTLATSRQPKNINISGDDFDYLIKISDLKKTTAETTGYNVLSLALLTNKDSNLNLTENHWSQIIKGSDLKWVIQPGRDALTLYLENKKNQEIKLKEEDIDFLIENYNPYCAENILLAATQTKEKDLLKKILSRMDIHKKEDLYKITHLQIVLNTAEEMLEREEVLKTIAETIGDGRGAKGHRI